MVDDELTGGGTRREPSADRPRDRWSHPTDDGRAAGPWSGPDAQPGDPPGAWPTGEGPGAWTGSDPEPGPATQPYGMPTEQYRQGQQYPRAGQYPPAGQYPATEQYPPSVGATQAFTPADWAAAQEARRYGPPAETHPGPDSPMSDWGQAAPGGWTRVPQGEWQQTPPPARVGVPGARPGDEFHALPPHRRPPLPPPGQEEDPEPRDRRLRWPVVVAVTALPLLAVLALAQLLPGASSTHAHDSVTATTAPPHTRGTTPAASTTTTPPTTTTTTMSVQAGIDLREIGAAEATQLIRESGHDLGGSVIGAWTWTDANGLNLLAVARSSTRSGGGRFPMFAARSVTFDITHLARLHEQPTELRRMHDPVEGRCRGEYQSGVTPGSVSARDLDGDGISDVTVGWTAHCLMSGLQTRVRLALLSDGKKFIARGQFVLHTGAAGSLQVSPDAGSWPPAFLGAIQSLAGQLYN